MANGVAVCHIMAAIYQLFELNVTVGMVELVSFYFLESCDTHTQTQTAKCNQLENNANRTWTTFNAIYETELESDRPFISDGKQTGVTFW